MTFNLDNFLIVDYESGTCFSADRAILLDTTLMSEADCELFDHGTDADRGDVAAKLGAWLHDQINPQTLHYDTNQ